MILLAIFAVLLGGTAVSLVFWSVVLPRVRAAQRVRDINAYGFAAVRPASLPVISMGEGGILGPLANKVGNLLSRWVGTVREDNLRAELKSAGIYGISPRLFIGYRALTAVVLGGLVVWSKALSDPLVGTGLAVACGWAGWIAPLVIVRRKARERLAEIDRTLPDLIDLLVVTIEAGLSFGASMKLAGTRIEGPLGDELRLTLQEHEMGRSLNEALKQLAERAATPSTQSFVRAIVQGQILGVSIGTIMRNLAGEMRTRRRQTAEERAQKAPTKMLFPLIFLIFPAMGIILLGPAVFEIARTLGT